MTGTLVIGVYNTNTPLTLPLCPQPGGEGIILMRLGCTCVPQAHSLVRLTRARVVSIYEAVNRGHDKIFASNNKKEEISTKKDQTRSMGAEWSPFYSVLISTP